MTARLADVEPSPDVFAAVMATGILSIAARDHRRLFTFVAACAVLDGRLASHRIVLPGLGVVALTAWLALCIYALMTWLILWRTVVERQDRDGFEPDSWILMGGLAVATLAGAHIHALAPAWLAGPVLAVTVVTWAMATLWIPPLIHIGLRRISRRPTMLAFAGVWWALVFRWACIRPPTMRWPPRPASRRC